MQPKTKCNVFVPGPLIILLLLFIYCFVCALLLYPHLSPLYFFVFVLDLSPFSCTFSLYRFSLLSSLFFVCMPFTLVYLFVLFSSAVTVFRSILVVHVHVLIQIRNLGIHTNLGGCSAGASALAPSAVCTCLDLDLVYVPFSN